MIHGFNVFLTKKGFCQIKYTEYTEYIRIDINFSAHP